MGRYSSVQAYTDQQNTRTTTYEQERGSTASNTVKTEKVHNPYGSTAGAGSGEFHVYRHARAREQERLKKMDETEREQMEEEEFQRKVNDWKSDEDRRLSKKRKKRAKAKSAKLRKKNLSLSGVMVHQEGDNGNDDGDDDEFEYTPLHLQKQNDPKDGTSSSSQGDKKVTQNDKSSSVALPVSGTKMKEVQDSAEKVEAPPPFENDGSFMEMMRKKMQEESNAKTSKVE